MKVLMKSIPGSRNGYLSWVAQGGAVYCGGVLSTDRAQPSLFSYHCSDTLCQPASMLD